MSSESTTHAGTAAGGGSTAQADAATEADTTAEPDTTAERPPPGGGAGSAALMSGRIHTLNRPNMVSVGVIVWLSSELMFFAGLFGIYFTHRAVAGTDQWPPPPTELNVPYALVFTVILVASSFTCQFGVFAAERGDVFALRRWYLLSLLLGLIFVLGQANEYRTLIAEGTTLASSSFGTVFFLTTGFHGLHVIGGLIGFLLLIVRTKISKFSPAQATSAIVVSYYWHFVDVVWIGLFATIYIIQ